MKELIKVSQVAIGTSEVNSVNARDLHATLEIKKDYSNWFKAQINTLGLEENIDFITYAQKGDGGKFGKKEYIITLDTAKHISMASRTQKGKEIRNYFIEVEKEIKSLGSTKNIEDMLKNIFSLKAEEQNKLENKEIDISKMLDRWDNYLEKNLNNFIFVNTPKYLQYRKPNIVFGVIDGLRQTVTIKVDELALFCDKNNFSVRDFLSIFSERDLLLIDNDIDSSSSALIGYVYKLDLFTNSLEPLITEYKNI